MSVVIEIKFIKTPQSILPLELGVYKTIYGHRNQCWQNEEYVRYLVKYVNYYLFWSKRLVFVVGSFCCLLGKFGLLVLCTDEWDMNALPFGKDELAEWLSTLLMKEFDFVDMLLLLLFPVIFGRVVDELLIITPVENCLPINGGNHLLRIY